MEIKFKILGKPRGKGRPRICIRYGRQIAYTPKQTSEYGSRACAAGGRRSKYDEQEKTQRIVSGSERGDNVFDRANG